MVDWKVQGRRSEVLGVGGTRSGHGVEVALFSTFEDAERSWRDVEARGACFVFQSFDWCATWFETIGRARQVEPLLAYIREPASGAAMFLPLGIERKRFGVRCLGFLAARLADHTGPILAGPTDAVFDSDTVSRILRGVESAGRCDVSDFWHLRGSVDGRRNPLVELGCGAAGYRTHSLRIEGSWEAFWAEKVPSKHSADSRRQHRRLAERGRPRFVVATTVEQALAITDAMLAQKSRRYRETGRDDPLTSGAYRDFYLSTTRRYHGCGLIHVSALMLDNRVLATHWGTLWKGRLVSLMPSFEGGEWARYSPGRLLLEHLLEWCFEQGLREFDFTIGDEPYKAAFCNQSDALYRLIRARSALGWAYHAKSRLSAPRLRGLMASNGPVRQSHAPHGA
jgi:CelD/BcsL family acetyltransferase involved in cellulose biosynthesis